MNRLLLGLLLLSAPVSAATVTVPGQTITLPAQNFSLPAQKFTVAPQVVTIPAGVAGPAGPAGANGKDGAAADLAPITARITALEAQVAALLAGGAVSPAAVALADPCAGKVGKWSTLSLTPKDNIAMSFACASPGFKLTLTAGTYAQVFDVPAGLDGWDIGGVSAATVKLSGSGGCTVSDNNQGSGGPCKTRLAWGKGVVHLSSAGTLHDLDVEDGGTKAVNDHDGQAGVYVDGASGTVTLRKLMIRNNQNGIFSNAPNADIIIDQSDFVGNSTDGGSHDTYLSDAKSVLIQNCNTYGSNHGNNFKTRSGKVTVIGGYNKSNEGRWVECADGCVLTITGGVYVGSTISQNVFGNGTESVSKGPGNTTWSGSSIWIGRGSNFANAGTFNASGLTVTWAAGGGIFNDKGVALTGLPLSGTAVSAAPASPAFVSGAK
ncbi:MAG: hypothetical protein JWP29_3528 [Rhodoferax sp.]|nr:hypothetical protein [Rhodoferax sp.]